jgi:hypothetical protein
MPKNQGFLEQALKMQENMRQHFLPVHYTFLQPVVFCPPNDGACHTRMIEEIRVFSRASEEITIAMKIGQCAKANEIANKTGQPIFEAWVHQKCKLEHGAP